MSTLVPALTGNMSCNSAGPQFYFVNLVFHVSSYASLQVFGHRHVVNIALQNVIYD